MAARTFVQVMADRATAGGIIKVGHQHQVVFAVALESDIPDRQGDVIHDDDLLDAAITAGMGNVDAGVMHTTTTGIGKMVASFPMTKDIAADLGITLPNGRGLWLVGLKIEDPATWADVVAGKFKGVSIGGAGIREEIEA